MDAPTLPVQPLSYDIPRTDIWRPVARLAAWIGIALGLFNILDLLYLWSMFLRYGGGHRYSPDPFLPTGGLQLVLAALADGALGTMIIWGGIGYLRSHRNGRKLFLYAAAGTAAMSVISAALLLAFESSRSRLGGRVLSPEVIFITTATNLREMLLPLLLWILMFKSQPMGMGHARFSGTPL